MWLADPESPLGFCDERDLRRFLGYFLWTRRDPPLEIDAADRDLVRGLAARDVRELWPRDVRGGDRAVRTCQAIPALLVDREQIALRDHEQAVVDRVEIVHAILLDATPPRLT